LVPLSSVSLQTLQEGTASVKEVVFAQVKVRPIALCETFDDLAAPTIARAGQTYAITGAVKSGSYNLSVTYDGDTATTYEIPFNATVNQIEDAILAALVSLDWPQGTDSRPVRVVQTDAQSWAVSYWDSGAYLSGVNGANLVGFAGKVGTLSLNTAEALAFIGSESLRRATFEVEIEVDGERQTLVQVSSDVSADLVLAGAFEPSSLEEALSETVANERFVRRDADQTLDATSKDQIWENITGVTTPTGVNLVAALTGASAPSGANVFVTSSALPNQSLNTTDGVNFDSVTIAAGGGLNLGSTAGIFFDDGSAQYTALPNGTQDGYIIRWNIGTNKWEENPIPNLFDQSLNTADAVAFTTLTATDGVTSTLVDQSGITFPDATVQTSAPIYSALSGQSGGSGSTIHNGDYPDEIQIVIGGVTYAMPARQV